MIATLELTTHLGPAKVLQAAGNRAQLELPDELVWAQIALAFPYQVTAGDTILAVGQGGSWFVIGVLQGTGTTTLTVPGDLKLQAPRGTIEVSAGKGVRIKSPTVEIMAKRLELAAQALFERLGEATRWVKDTFQLRVGRWRTRVETTYDLKADRIVARADNDVKIDGRKIDLG